jgi:hypothetical protein
MVVELIGWFCTITVLFGFYANAIKKHTVAMLLWIIGDIGWIIYDSIINNWSHAALSISIILINVYGLIFHKKEIKLKIKE